MNQPSRQAVNRVFCHGPDDRAVQLNTDSLPSVVASHGVAATADRQGEKQMSRHEVFTNAAPATGGVLTTALEYSAFTEETAGPDPVFDLIAAEANAFARFNAACRNTDSVVLGREPTAEEEAEYKAADGAQMGALFAVMRARSTTGAGLIAAIDLFVERELQNVSDPVDKLLAELLDSIRAFATAGQPPLLSAVDASRSSVAPNVAALPLSRDLLDSYDAFLHFERRKLRWERFGPEGYEHAFDDPEIEVVFRDSRTGKCFDFVSIDNAGGQFHDYGPAAPKASDRAAVVLAAVGCDWRREG